MRAFKTFLLALFLLPLSAMAMPSASDANDPNSLMAEALEYPLRSIDKALQSAGDNTSPIVAAQHIGQQALTAYEALQVFQAVQGNSWKAKLMKPIYFVCGMFLLTCGYLLGVVLPFVPLVFFLGGALLWFVAVVLGTTLTGVFVMLCIAGDETRRQRMGEQLLSLAADVILRPSIMVIAFLAAGVAASGLLKLVFMFAFPFILSLLPVSFIGIMCKLAALMVLARLIVFVVASMFSLVLSMPDMALNFLGVASKRVRISWRV